MKKKIIRNALFLITHELVSILLQDDPNLNKTDDWHIIIDILKRDFKGGVLRHPQRDLNYKGDLRDLEFALKGVTDINNEPFLPKNFTGEFRPVTEIRQQAVANGFERFWETFRSILVQHNILEPRSDDISLETDISPRNESISGDHEPLQIENNRVILDESVSGDHDPLQIENNGVIPEVVKSTDL